MNKQEIEEYLKKLYTIYEQKNFDEFVSTCLSYNVRIGDYQKNISNLTKKVFDKILSVLPSSKSKFSYKEFIYSYKINLEYKSVNSVSEVIIDVPVFENNYETITLRILNFLIENQINSKIKLMKIVKNSILQVRIYDVDDTKKFIDYFKNDEIISKEVKSRVFPLLPQTNLLGIYTEYRPYDFKNFSILYLYEFFSTLDKSKFEIEEYMIINDYYEYILNKYKNEKKLNKKRMLLVLYKSLDIIINNKNVGVIIMCTGIAIGYTLATLVLYALL